MNETSPTLAPATHTGAPFLGVRYCPPGGHSGTLRAGSGSEILYARGQYLVETGEMGEALRAYSCAAQCRPVFELAWHAVGVPALDMTGLATTPPERIAFQPQRTGSPRPDDIDGNGIPD